MTPEAIKAQTAKLKKAMQASSRGLHQEKSKKTPLLLSSASRQGVQDVLRALFKVIDAAREQAEPADAKEEAWQP
jgi:GTP-binding protein